MKIFLLAFRGTGGFRDPKYSSEPALIRAGHVGIQFEGDDRIFGFHPTLAAETAAGGEDAIIDLLKNHIGQSGAVQDDTSIFERAYILFKQGEHTEVFVLTYEVEEEEFHKMRQTLLEWYNMKKEFTYNFPNHDGTFAENHYNCAIFPKLLGLPLPSENGLVSHYIGAMRLKGAKAWQWND